MSVRACVNFFIQTTSPLKPFIWFWPNFTGMISRCSSTNVVQTVPVGCISRSWGEKKGFQNALFKNLLLWNIKAQSFHIWYIPSSRGPLPNLFKFCPWGQNWPLPRGHTFTLNYIGKLLTSSLEPLMEIWPNSTGMIPGPLPKLLKWFWLVARKNVLIMPLV